MSKSDNDHRWTRDRYNELAEAKPKKIILNPHDPWYASAYPPVTLETHIARAKINPEDPPRKRIAVRDYPGILAQYVVRLTELNPDPKIVFAHLGICRAGWQMVERMESVKSIETLRAASMDEFNPFDSAALFDEVPSHVAVPELRSNPRRMDVPLDTFRVDQIEQLALALAMPQAAVVRTLVIAGFSESYVFIPRGIVDMCRFEIDRLDRRLMFELEERREVMLKISEWRNAS